MKVSLSVVVKTVEEFHKSGQVVIEWLGDLRTSINNKTYLPVYK